ncbi:hypothetical protein [Aureliella helgolandensis]|uniref:Uncharacterized protein n=1 Tax=Aureliella helgolandensis TaxID=2527968 RepID=A0A518GBX4_9BACT|nr:hypothetical protein [Aureliella helgolandensis]QDV26073.1 hypothetical protein Q31a_44440 [Aureliella helgolandensis]
MTIDQTDSLATAREFRELQQEMADSTAAMLGIHTLGEAVFCQRAAVLTLEKQEEDVGLEESALPVLGGLPTHDIDRIQAKLESLWRELRFWPLIVASCILPALIGLALMGNYYIAVLVSVSLVVFSRWPYELWCEIKYLQERLMIAQVAIKSEPDWTQVRTQAVDWWSLIRAGFNSVEKTRVLIDAELKIQGKPWRVLQRGQYQYPVILVKCDSEERLNQLRDGKLHPQQVARLVAYSCLLTLQERTKSEWAIVLFAGTDTGIAVPIVEKYFDYFKSGLATGRRLISNKDHGHRDIAEKPTKFNPCAGCRFGAPEVYRLQQGLAQTTPYLTRGTDGKLYHSQCGDRFGDVPLHRASEELGLHG